MHTIIIPGSGSDLYFDLSPELSQEINKKATSFFQSVNTEMGLFFKVCMELLQDRTKDKNFD